MRDGDRGAQFYTGVTYAGAADPRNGLDDSRHGPADAVLPQPLRARDQDR